MTQTAVLAGNEQRVNFLNVFIRSKTTSETIDALASKEAAAVNPIFDWFGKSSILEPVAFKSIPAGKIFQADRAIVKFKLSGVYHDHFVLFRGLLEFSRPKRIVYFIQQFRKNIRTLCRNRPGDGGHRIP